MLLYPLWFLGCTPEPTMEQWSFPFDPPLVLDENEIRDELIYEGEPLELTQLPENEPLDLEVRVVFEDQGASITVFLDVCLAGQELDDLSCDVLYAPRPNQLVFPSAPPEIGDTVLIAYQKRRFQ